MENNNPCRLVLALLLSVVSLNAVVLNRPPPQFSEDDFPKGRFETLSEIECRLGLIEAQIWSWEYWKWRENTLVNEMEVENFLEELDIPILLPLKDALSLFVELTENSEVPLDILLKERADLRASFRNYMLTGELITPVESEFALAHLLLNEDSANYMEAGYYFDWIGFAHVSIIVRKTARKKYSGFGKDPRSQRADSDLFGKALHQLWVKSGLGAVNIANFPDGHKTFFSDKSVIGFECDDYATAFNHYVQNKIDLTWEGGATKYLFLFWHGDGHAMSVVHYKGTYYIVDAFTGMIFGPMKSEAEVEKAAWSALRESGVVNFDAVIIPRLFGSVRIADELPWNEPLPFYCSHPVMAEFRKQVLEIRPSDPNYHLLFQPNGRALYERALERHQQEEPCK